MGDVMIVYKIMPEGPEEDLERIKEKIEELMEEHGELKDTNEEKVAFGLKAVMAKIVIPEEDGLVDKVEDGLKEIKGVQSVEAVDITLIN